MRINVYGEELTDRVEHIKKVVNQELFHGIRLYLKSHPDLHHSVDDNDESAITLWVPWTRKGGHKVEQVVSLLRKMADELERWT